MALVLSRRVGERVMIGDNVTVQVVEVSGQRVRLAFDAPRDMLIMREEIVNEMLRTASRGCSSDEGLVHGLYR